MIVYDVTNAESFVNTKRWIEEVKDNCGENVAIILAGNKCDAPNRVVLYDDQEKYAKAINLPFFETSAKDNINIDEVFHELTRLILQKQNANNNNNNNTANGTSGGNNKDGKNKDKVNLKDKKDKKFDKQSKCCK